MGQFWHASLHRAALSLGLLFLCTLHSPAHSRLLPGQLTRVQRFLKHIIAQQKVEDMALAASESDFVSLNTPLALQSTSFAMSPAPGPTSCPPTVSECDFYLAGFPASLPTLPVGSTPPDTRIATVITAVQGAAVIAINTDMADYVCSSPALPSDNQFYITGNALQVRTIQNNLNGTSNVNGTNQVYSGKYVKLMFTSLEISQFGMTMNLNQGQSNPQFPEGRRCVVFQT